MFRYAFSLGLVLVLAISGAVGRVSGFFVILRCVVGLLGEVKFHYPC